MDVGPLIYRAGASVGLVGGAVFVLANRNALGSPLGQIALIVWALSAGVAAWAVWLRRSPLRRVPGPLAPRAGLIYGLSCLGMVALIQLGSRAVAAIGRAEAVPAVIVIAVGLHFLPFRRAFGLPLFTRLGAVVAVIGVIGLATHLVLGSPAGAAAAVLAGVVMTLLIAGDNLTRPPSSGTTPAGAEQGRGDTGPTRTTP